MGHLQESQIKREGDMYKNKVILSKCLRQKDTIGIVAPAWSLERYSFRNGIEMLRELGYRVKYDKCIFNHYGYMAGNDRQRGEQINRMFADKEVKAIFCAKAGYGAIRTIPYLDEKIIKSNPKIFIGYSDISILLYYLYSVAKMVVFHGPIISGEIYEDMNEATLNYLLRAVSQPYRLGELKFDYLKVLRPGRAKGVLIGGNLSMFINTLGTPYEIDTTGAILFLEDIGEGLDVIDNYLMHLKLAGKLDKIKGLVFGRMVDCMSSDSRRYNIKKILDDILKNVDIPIVSGFPSGHMMQGRVNVTLPLGVLATLDANNPRLIINEAGVRK